MTSDTALLKSLVMTQLDALSAADKVITSEVIVDLIFKTSMLIDLDDDSYAAARDQVAKDIEASINVHIGGWNSLSDDSDHQPWLAEQRDTIEWRFWDRYERHLTNSVGLPRVVVDNLASVTDDILGRLEAPTRAGSWDRRGLVAGQVQSGKTGNYTGLIAKALDSGYKLVVVLAGVHNSLRSQTQYRIDEGILGFDTRTTLLSNSATSKIGVGKLAGPFLHVNSFTSSSGTGDFKLNVAKNLGVVVGGNDPIVLVVKKNSSILNNLYQWATNLKKETDPTTGRSTVRDVPLLVIDDEADHASVDTNGPKRGQSEEEVDPTRINGLIRKFLDTFAQSAYVAYTATPFANIFINPVAEHDEAGIDLFPRSFIVNLPASSEYTGPAQVFGLAANEAQGTDERPPLPITRQIWDHEDWMPDGHKKDHIPEEMPESLRDAILSFFISVAVRRLRGQAGKHHSMLVHVTRFKDVQRCVRDAVADEVEDVRQRLKMGEGENPTLRARFDNLWAEDYTTTHSSMSRADLAPSLIGELPSAAEVWALLVDVVDDTIIHLVNGDSSDALEYVDHPDGLTVIAIGGDKLSRGLTLEGLTVSYYLRASRMYDTLMQMGRWFGYRHGYLDLCRLYTPAQLQGWYARITAAADELQSDFDAMAVAGRTPMDFGLRVQQHPDGLMVTSPTKLRHATALSISYAGTMPETVVYSVSERRHNWKAFKKLVAQLPGESLSDAGLTRWVDVPATTVIGFLESYRGDPSTPKTNSKALIEYIESRLKDDELINWTVAVATPTASAEGTVPPINVDRLPAEARVTVRSALKGSGDKRSIRRVVSPLHALIDLDPSSSDWAHALEETITAWEQSTRPNKSKTAPTVPSGLSARRIRPVERGLLLVYPLQIIGDPSASEPDSPFVGFALPFPTSDKARPVSYQINKVFWDQEYGFEEDE
jgi:hypothetical protein